ncbi:DUF2835 family protein [Spongorhabdus nitratireducens]
MNKAIFSVNLNSDQVLMYYKGQKKSVRVHTQDGMSMSLPFEILLEHVTRSGIYGTFEISYGNDGKLQQLRRLS